MQLTRDLFAIAKFLFVTGIFKINVIKVKFVWLKISRKMYIKCEIQK